MLQEGVPDGLLVKEDLVVLKELLQVVLCDEVLAVAVNAAEGSIRLEVL